ncbi:MAG: acyl carrier protein [Planctomycetales bacterium]
MNAISIQLQLVEFLVSLTGQDALQSDSDLQAAGVTDSLTMMDLLVFIETEFKVRLDFGDLTPEVFRTPGTIAELIALHLAGSRRQHAA